MDLSRTASKINGDFSRKSQNFPHPPYILRPRWQGSTWNWVLALGVKKLEWWGPSIHKRKRSKSFYLRVSAVLATATCLAGWLAVTLRYCIKTAKPIWKLFRPSESPIILVSWDPCADTQFQGNPSAGALNTRGVGKLAIFVRFSTYIAVYLGNGAR